ncbi:hypothetical protein BGX38DRAFT_1188799, partial [Terfezia claveryi]
MTLWCPMSSCASGVPCPLAAYGVPFSLWQPDDLPSGYGIRILVVVSAVSQTSSRAFP